MDENRNALSKADLQQIVERAGGNIAQLMGQQNTALMLLGGTTAAFMAANSGILNSALAAIMTQSGLMHTQLGYNATAVDSASDMQLLISTLSGDVGGIIDGLKALSGYGERMSGNMEKIAPLVGQMANSGGGINDAANTVFGGIGAMSSVGDAMERVNIGGIGNALAGVGKAAGVMGKLGALAPLLTTAAPLLVGGLAVAGVGTMAYKAYKNYQAKKEAQAEADQTAENPITERSIMDPVALENTENAPGRTLSLPARDPLTEREIMDPDSIQIRRTGRDSTTLTGAEDDMFAPRQTPPPEESRPTAANAAQHGRLELADAGLIAEISGLRQEIRKLADKPFDPNVRAEVVIKSLRTNMTYPEFEEAIERKFMNDLQVSSMPMW